MLRLNPLYTFVGSRKSSRDGGRRNQTLVDGPSSLWGITSDAQYIWEASKSSPASIAVYSAHPPSSGISAMLYYRTDADTEIHSVTNVESTDSSLRWVAIWSQLQGKEIWKLTILTIPGLMEGFSLSQATKAGNNAHRLMGVNCLTRMGQMLLGLLYADDFEVYRQIDSAQSPATRFEWIYSASKDPVFYKKPLFHPIRGTNGFYNTAITSSEDRFYVSRVFQDHETELWYFIASCGNMDDGGVNAANITIRCGRFGPPSLKDANVKDSDAPFVIHWMKPFSTPLGYTGLDASSSGHLTPPSASMDLLEGVWCVGEQSKNLIIARVDSPYSKQSIDIWGSVATASSRLLCSDGFMVGAKVVDQSGLLLVWDTQTDNRLGGPFIHLFENHYTLSEDRPSASLSEASFHTMPSLMSGIQRYPRDSADERENPLEWTPSQFLYPRGTALKASMDQEVLRCGEACLCFCPQSMIRYGRFTKARTAVAHTADYNGLFSDLDWADTLCFSAVVVCRISDGLYASIQPYGASLPHPFVDGTTASASGHRMVALTLYFQCSRKLVLDAMQRHCLTMLRTPRLCLRALQDMCLLPMSCPREAATLNSEEPYAPLSEKEAYVGHCLLDRLLLNGCMDFLCTTILLRDTSNPQTPLYEGMGSVFSEGFFHFASHWASKRFEALVTYPPGILSPLEAPPTAACIIGIEDCLSRHNMEIRGIRDILGALMTRRCYYTESLQSAHNIHIFSYCCALVEWSHLLELLKDIVLEGVEESYGQHTLVGSKEKQEITVQDRRYVSSHLQVPYSIPSLDWSRFEGVSLHTFLKETLSQLDSPHTSVIGRSKRGKRLLFATTPVIMVILDLILPAHRDHQVQQDIIELCSNPLLASLIPSQLPQAVLVLILKTIGVLPVSWGKPNSKHQAFTYEGVVSTVLTLLYYAVKTSVEQWEGMGIQEAAVWQTPQSYTEAHIFLVYIVALLTASAGDISMRQKSERFGLMLLSDSRLCSTIEACALLDLLMDSQSMVSSSLKRVPIGTLCREEPTLGFCSLLLRELSHPYETDFKDTTRPFLAPHRWLLMERLSKLLPLADLQLLIDPSYALLEMVALKYIAPKLNRDDIRRLMTVVEGPQQPALASMAQIEPEGKEGSFLGPTDTLQEYTLLQHVLDRMGIHSFTDSQPFLRLYANKGTLLKLLHYDDASQRQPPADPNYRQELQASLLNSLVAAQMIGYLECGDVLLAVEMFDAISELSISLKQAADVLKCVLYRLTHWSLYTNQFNIMVAHFMKQKDNSATWVLDSLLTTAIPSTWKIYKLHTFNAVHAEGKKRVAEYRRCIVKEAIKSLITLHRLRIVTNSELLQQVVDAILSAESIFDTSELLGIVDVFLSNVARPSLIEEAMANEPKISETLTRLRQQLLSSGSVS